MKGNSTGHASARGFCIPMPWHPLMLDLSLPWGDGDRWQIWPPCLEPGTSMAEATTRCTLSHDFGQEVCLSLLGWWNTACVTKFGEHASFLHFEVSLWSTCNLCLLFLSSLNLNLTYKKAVRDISYFDILTSLSLSTGVFVCKFFIAKLCWQKFCNHKRQNLWNSFFHAALRSCNFRFVSSPQCSFCPCRHTVWHGDSNFQTVALPIKLPMTELDFNLTKQKLWSKFCSRVKKVSGFNLCKTIVFHSLIHVKTTQCQKILFFLTKLDSPLLASCYVFVSCIPTATWSQTWAPRTAPPLSPPSCFSYSPFGPHQCNRQSHCFSRWVQMEEKLPRLEILREK